MLVAVSGGADSVCLLRVLHVLCEAIPIDLVAAHFNHGWRGDESAEDAEFVRKLCEGLQIELFSHDTAALRRGSRCGGDARSSPKTPSRG